MGPDHIAEHRSCEDGELPPPNGDSDYPCSAKATRSAIVIQSPFGRPACRLARQNRRMMVAPRDLGPAGKRLWRDVMAAYELNPAERRLLSEACAVLDVLARVREATVGASLVNEDGTVNRLLVEGRLQRLVLARLLAGLRFPEGVPVVFEDGLVALPAPKRRGTA